MLQRRIRNRSASDGFGGTGCIGRTSNRQQPDGITKAVPTEAPAKIAQTICKLLAGLTGLPCKSQYAESRDYLEISNNYKLFTGDELAANTLRRRLAGIRKVHRLFHLQNPAEDEEVLVAMRRALRSKTRRPRQAPGLTKELRDRALIMVGYDTMCRRSELAALRLEDLTGVSDGSMLALIRRAKNDPFGDGRDGFVSATAGAALTAWLEAGTISEGWLFRRVYAGQVGSDALHPHSIGRILKQRATAAGLPAEITNRLSGHSMRVGAAQDMVANGADILPVMRSGGWKSINVVARYVQNVELMRLSQWRP